MPCHSSPVFPDRTGPRGFTLLELLVAVVIIGLLAVYAAPRYFPELGKSKAKATLAKSQIDAFVRALEAYRLDVGRYPSTEEGLDVLLVDPGTSDEWNGPYLGRHVPTDPWGNAYVYRSPGNQGEIEIISYGADGKPGGSGEAADIAH